MKIDYSVRNYDYLKRDGNLQVEAQGKVKSKKYFPYFYEGKTKKIFKPLSKSKPFSTPYFAYSEVVWSHILHTFFDGNIPIYHLAICKGYEEELPKYHNYGTIVDSIIDSGEQLVNIYEYFMKCPDEHVTPEIRDYVNYCLYFYDYTFFFKSEWLKNNYELSSEIARQILYSILRGDQNYHYENVSFIFKDNNLASVAMPIDHEFSSFFMYLDQELSHNGLVRRYFSEMGEQQDEEGKIIRSLLGLDEKKSPIINNIEVITSLYPNVVEKFLASLDVMIESLGQEPIALENHDYLEAFSSEDYEVGILRYKENNLEAAAKRASKIVKRDVSVWEVNKKLNQEILKSATYLKKTLENKMMK